MWVHCPFLEVLDARGGGRGLADETSPMLEFCAAAASSDIVLIEVISSH
jgi:hypothetical protein